MYLSSEEQKQQYILLIILIVSWISWLKKCTILRWFCNLLLKVLLIILLATLQHASLRSRDYLKYFFLVAKKGIFVSTERPYKKNQSTVFHPGLGILSLVFWANRSFLRKNEQMSDSLIRSFLVSDLSNSLTVAHLYWAIWEICSQSLIWFEQNEQMSKWANEQWANEWIPSPDSTYSSYTVCIVHMQNMLYITAD